MYGPLRGPAGVEPTRQLDEGLSYWRVIGPTHGGGHQGRATWMTYAQASVLPGPRPTFEAFCSMHEMHHRLTTLLAVDAVRVEPLDNVAPRH